MYPCCNTSDCSFLSEAVALVAEQVAAAPSSPAPLLDAKKCVVETQTDLQVSAAKKTIASPPSSTPSSPQVPTQASYIPFTAFVQFVVITTISFVLLQPNLRSVNVFFDSDYALG